MIFPIIDSLKEIRKPSSNRSDDVRVIEDVKPLFIVAEWLPLKAASDHTIMGMNSMESSFILANSPPSMAAGICTIMGMEDVESSSVVEERKFNKRNGRLVDYHEMRNKG